MGEISVALDEELGREVALKQIVSNKADHGGFRRKFKFEAEITGNLEHPGIIPIYGLGAGPDGRPYYAMRLVHGDNLQQKISEFHEALKKGRSNFDSVEFHGLVDRLIDVAQSISYAHSRGVLHRDLKPGNILVGEYGETLVIDWGLAKLPQGQEGGDPFTSTEAGIDDKAPLNVRSGSDVDATVQGSMLGTLGYAPPEQVNGRVDLISEKSDVYALGAILYQVLTGHPPIHGDNKADLSELVKATIEGEITPPRQEHRKVPKALSAVCMKALQREPKDRYETVQLLIDEIERWKADQPVLAAPDSLADKLVRLGRRYRTAALAAAVATLGITTVTASALFFVNRARVGQAAARSQAEALVVEKTHLVTEKSALVEEKAELATAAEAEAIAARLAENAADRERDRAEASLARTNYFLAQSRRKDNRVDDALALLESIPNEYRNFEWRYNRRSIFGSNINCYGHQYPVGVVAFSPDGDRVISCSAIEMPMRHGGGLGAELKMWDAQSGAEIPDFWKGRLDVVSTLAWSPDGSVVFTGGFDGSIRTWSPQSGKELGRFSSAHSGRVNCIAIDPSGNRLVSGSDKPRHYGGDVSKSQLILWNCDNGEILKTLSDKVVPIHCVAFSRDGSQIVSGTEDGTLTVWNAETGDELLLGGHGPEIVYDVVYSPQGGQIVSAGGDGRLKVWDAQTGKKLHDLVGHTGWVCSVDFSPDGRYIVSGSQDRTVRLWNARTSQQVQSFSGHNDTIHDVRFSPNGQRVVSGSSDKTLKFWEMEMPGSASQSTSVDSRTTIMPSGTHYLEDEFSSTIKYSEEPEARTLSRHSDLVTCVDFSPDGSIFVSGSWDGSVILWDSRNAQIKRVLTGPGGRISDVACGIDGSVVCGTYSGDMRMWDSEGVEKHTLKKEHTPAEESDANLNHVFCVALSPDACQFVSGGLDSLKLWDAKTGMELKEFRNRASRDVVFSPDGRRIFVSGFGSPRAWDTETGVEIQPFRKNIGTTTHGLSINPDGTLVASANSNGTIQLWNTKSGMPIRTIFGHDAHVFDVCFSPDGSRLVSASRDGTLKLWDAATGEELKTLAGHEDSVFCVAFDPKGNQIVSGSADKTLKIWRAPVRTETRVLEHAAPVTSVCFNSDEQLIMSGDETGEIRIWDAATCNELRTISGNGMVLSLAASLDGHHIAAGTGYGTIDIWDARTGRHEGTLERHLYPVVGLKFLEDSSQIRSTTGFDEFTWDRATGRKLSEEDVWDTALGISFSGESGLREFASGESKDGRRLLVPYGRLVLVVDRDFKRDDGEMAFRRKQAAPHPLWHAKRALKSKLEGNWYAATFHYAWLVKSEPTNRSALEEMRLCWQRFEADPDAADVDINVDVNLDGVVSPLDVLEIINALGTPRILDANGDGQCSPIDALLVINRLSRRPVDPRDVPDPVRVLHLLANSRMREKVNRKDTSDETTVSYSLTACDSNRQEIRFVERGKKFFLVLSVQDTRGPTAQGVFAAHADILYPKKYVQIEGPAIRSHTYSSGAGPSVEVPGMIVGAGGVDGLAELGGNKLEVVRFPMSLKAMPDDLEIQFASQFSEDTVSFPTLHFGGRRALPAKKIAFGTLTLKVDSKEPKKATEKLSIQGSQKKNRGESVDDEKTASFTLTATDANDQNFETVELGKTFYLVLSVQDTRGSTARGVFAAHTDIIYPSEYMQLEGPAVRSAKYNTVGTEPDVAKPGIIVGAGGIDGLAELGGNKLEVVRFPMSLKAKPDDLKIKFVTRYSRDVNSFPTLHYGGKEALSSKNIEFGELTLPVSTARKKP